MTTKNQIDMTQGPIFTKLLMFSVPLIFSSVLQLLFNAADIVIVGRYAVNGDDCLAAVGSNGSLINLIVNLFQGLAIGTNVVAANFFGAGKKKELKDTVQTAMVMSVIAGIILTVIGVVFAKPLLIMMKSPEEVIDLAVLYLRIYFGGITAMMIYNYGSSVLRAKGDTKRPLYILLVAGIINVLLNFIFVKILKMDVDGVALATVISQSLSAFCVVLLLVKENDEFHFDIKHLYINGNILAKMIKIGVPAGFQGMMFSFSNVFIQSSINSFGHIMVAGNSAVINLEGFVYTSMNGLSQGTLTFCSQNMGAGKKDRIKKVVFTSQISVFTVGLILGGLFLLFGRSLIGIYTTNPDVIEVGMQRCWIIFTTYYLCGMMDSMGNAVRGIGHSLLPAIITIFCVCIMRIVWLATIFQIPEFHVPQTIFLSYPISWILAFVIHTICFVVLINKKPKITIQ